MHYGTNSSRKCQDKARGLSTYTAIVRFERGVEQGAWGQRQDRRQVKGAVMGPKAPRFTVLSIEEEAIIVAFRRHTLLPLDDCLYALQATIPSLHARVVASLSAAA